MDDKTRIAQLELENAQLRGICQHETSGGGT